MGETNTGISTSTSMLRCAGRSVRVSRKASAAPSGRAMITMPAAMRMELRNAVQKSAYSKMNAYAARPTRCSGLKNGALRKLCQKMRPSGRKMTTAVTATTAVRGMLKLRTVICVAPAKAGAQLRNHANLGSRTSRAALARDDATFVAPAKAGAQLRNHANFGSRASRAALARDDATFVAPAKAGAQLRSHANLGSRTSRFTLARDDAAVSDRCDASRLALGQLRHFLPSAVCHCLRNSRRLVWSSACNS